MKRIVQIVLFFHFPVILLAQDQMYSQFYANPAFLNPALTGSSHCSRLNLQYRNQWPSLQNAFVNYYASYDHYFESLSSGVGVLVNSEREGNGILQTTNLSGLYAYHFALSKDWSMSTGLQFGYFNRAVASSELIFSDQLNIDDGSGTMQASLEQIGNLRSVSYTDFSYGVVAGYKEKIYLGLAAHHLLRPNISLVAGHEEELAMRYTAHLGAIFSLTNGLYSKEDVYLSPNVLYTRQQNFQQLNAGFYVVFPYIVFGTWFRHNFDNPDAVVALVGIKHKKMKFGYSYDIGVSGAKPGVSGAHELSFSYTFCVNNNKRRKFKTIKCPTF